MVGQALADVFVSALAPPLAIATFGYVLGRRRDVDVEALSTVTIYLFMPALVFHSLVTMPIGGEMLLVLVVAMVAFTGAMAAIAATVCRLAGETGSVLSAATLAAAFPNTGNFGIPVATFAFGDVGRTTAVTFVLVQSVLIYTLGVYVLSRGGEGGGRRAAVGRVLKLPITYAVFAAGAALAFGLVPPPDGSTMRAIQLVGDASIPLFLVVLGLQIANMNPARTIGRVVPTVGTKLLAAPVIAVVVAIAIGIVDHTAGRAFVVLAAGPAAVTPMVLTIEFTEGSEEGVSAADYVGTVVLLTIAGSLPIVSAAILLFELVG